MANIDLLENTAEMIMQVKRKSGEGYSPAKAFISHLHNQLHNIDPYKDVLKADRMKFIAARFAYQADDFKVNYLSQSGGSTDQIVSDLETIVNNALAEPMRPEESPFKHFKDKKLQAILERDLIEVQKTFEARAYKACIVLCGSILETALYEFLRRDVVRTNTKAIDWFKHKNPKSIEGDDWKLFELIAFACAHNLLPKDREETFHDTLRDPRNLIHPTAELKGAHKIDEDNAGMSKHALMVALAELYKKDEPWK